MDTKKLGKHVYMFDELFEFIITLLLDRVPLNLSDRPWGGCEGHLGILLHNIKNILGTVKENEVGIFIDRPDVPP